MNDADYMRQALQLARRGEGRVEPNPMVGCVLVKDNRVIGRGYHQAFGGPACRSQCTRILSAKPEWNNRVRHARTVLLSR
jgi:diaminohydroxyphosphoribosylaminopyrimidine deaminase/5-amino-6-(5-phosphoribosylamino)uracil reductase